MVELTAVILLDNDEALHALERRRHFVRLRRQQESQADQLYFCLQVFR